MSKQNQIDKLIEQIQEAADQAGADRADLVLLTRFMAESGDYNAVEIADAVEKPWKFVDVLAEAKAQVTT